MTPIRVLLADDFALFRRGLASLFAGEDGFEVVGEAVDGGQALEMSRDLMPDLILMDISPPAWDALEITRRIKAELPYVKIVVLTVSDAVRDPFEAVKCGAQGYFPNQIEPQELYENLRRIVQGEAPVSPAMAARLLEEFARPAEDPTPGSGTELTGRERAVLERVARGRGHAEVAAALSIAESSVKNHLTNVLEKLHLLGRIQAAADGLPQGQLATPSQSTR